MMVGNNVAKREPDDEVDKSVVVLGGFGEKELEEAQDLVDRVMAEVDGFKEVHFFFSLGASDATQRCNMRSCGLRKTGPPRKGRNARSPAS